MKSVSLMNIEKYVSPFSRSHYFKKYEPNKKQYEQMWLDQETEFWVKYIVSLKYFFKNSFSKFDDDCEKILIKFLQNLTSNDFNQVTLFLENAATCHFNFGHSLTLPYQTFKKENKRGAIHPEVKTKITLASSFMALLPAWESAKPGNDFQYEPPKEWFAANEKPELLESFIRAKWSTSQDLEIILGTKATFIKWWNTPVKKLEDFNFDAKAKTPSANKQKPKSTVQVSTSEVPLPKKVFNLPFSKPSTKKPPIIIPLSVSNENKKRVTAKKLAWQHNPMQVIHKLLEQSLLPVLHSNYYNVNVASLAANNSHFLKLAPLFAMGLEHLEQDFMVQLFKFQQKLANGEDCKDLFETWSTCQEILGVIHTKMGEFDAKKNLNNYSSYLFEPCVLVQLPTQQALLRQWLSAALITILKSEAETVEFRHWPVPKDVEPVVTELLQLLATTKEIIILVWYTMLFDQTVSASYDIELRTFLFHNMLESLPALQFFASDVSLKMVKSLKQMCFSSGKFQVSSVSIQNASYTPSIPELVSCYTNYFCNFMCWDENNDKCELMFPFNAEKSTNPLSLCIDKTQSCNSTCSKFSFNALSEDEKFLLNLISEDYKKHPKNYDYITSIILDIIVHIFIPCGHFSEEKSNTIAAFFSRESAKQEAIDILKTPFGELNNFQSVVLSAVMYNHINIYLESMKEEEDGLLISMNRLTAQVMQREQLVRLMAACANLINLDEIPKACTLSSCLLKCNVGSEILHLDEISKKVSEVKKQERPELWLQFPKEWTHSVDANMETPTLNNGIPAIISELEIRLGRIICNNGMNTLKKGKPFPYINIVHYVLPCYVSVLLDAEKLPQTERNARVRQNLVTFLHALVTHYETSYHSWLQGTLVPAPELGETCFFKESMSLHNSYIVDFAMFALAGMEDKDSRINDGEHLIGNSRFPHLKTILEHLHIFFPLDDLFSCIDEEDSEDTPTKWSVVPSSHKDALCKICYSVFPLSLKKNVSNHPKLQDLYLISMVTYQLGTIVNAQPTLLIIPQLNELATVMNDHMSILTTWMYNIFWIIFKSKDNQDIDDELIESFITEMRGREILVFTLNFIVELRNIIPGVIKVPHLPTFDSSEFEHIVNSFYEGNLKPIKLFLKKLAKDMKPHNANRDEEELRELKKVFKHMNLF